VTRAGTTTPFWWGSSITPAQAAYDGKADNRTVPVDRFEPNPWGLYNVHGNVWEWTEDCSHKTYQGAPIDGSAWTTACSDGSHRQQRGGSWNYFPQSARSASRAGSEASDRLISDGFRVARML
jgi:formylglycine-generating enzyme required for sulfatase activity